MLNTGSVANAVHGPYAAGNECAGVARPATVRPHPPGPEHEGQGEGGTGLRRGGQGLLRAAAVAAAATATATAAVSLMRMPRCTCCCFLRCLAGNFAVQRHYVSKGRVDTTLCRS
jgi:hypothetical protein